MCPSQKKSFQTQLDTVVPEPVVQVFASTTPGPFYTSVLVLIWLASDPCARELPGGM